MHFWCNNKRMLVQQPQKERMMQQQKNVAATKECMMRAISLCFTDSAFKYQEKHG
jgi:hypothetical protein